MSSDPRDYKFDQRYVEFKGYMEGVAASVAKDTRYYDKDEIFQELSILLMKLGRKYPGADDLAFRRIFVTSVSSLLAMMFRRNRTRRFVPTDINDKLNGTRDTAPGMDYALEIDNIVSQLDEKTGKMVRQLVDVNSAVPAQFGRKEGRQLFDAVHKVIFDGREPQKRKVTPKLVEEPAQDLLETA